ncbi:MAG: hypothetical protein GY816_18445 [Cytophagales bacterium]|nr:hypothetical protein [Cytophagales bacterium]
MLDECHLHKKCGSTIELKRSGFKVFEAPFGDWRLYLNATGYQIGDIGGCVISYEVEVEGTDSREHSSHGNKVRQVFYSRLWSQSGLLSGPKGAMGSRLKEVFVEASQQFLLDIDKKQSGVIKAAIAASETTEGKEFWSSFKLD